MARVTCTYEPPNLDDPRYGEDFDIWVERIDGDLVFAGVMERGSYKSVPELAAWGEARFSDIRFIDRAIEAVDDEEFVS